MVRAGRIVLLLLLLRWTFLFLVWPMREDVIGASFLHLINLPFHAAAVMGWWAGENLMDVAIYINDARALQLTLIGGQTGAEVDGHDWERILTMTSSLHLDHRLANITQSLGAALMIGCLVWAVVVAVRTKEESWLTGKL